MVFASRPRFHWQLRTRSLALGERTLMMAIVNLTPDSFSGDGSGRSVEVGLASALAAVDGGADIVDLGAESTRPNATPVSADEEQERLLPVLEGLIKQRPEVVASVDTYHAATARAAARAGAEIVNDVSGLLWDEGMAKAVAESGCGLVLMHTRGRPSEWQTQTRLRGDEVLPEVMAGLQEQLHAAKAARIREGKIVLDPGFGFGKVGKENFALLAGLPQLEALGRPLLIGLSRKVFLGEAVRGVQTSFEKSAAESRRTATVAANVAAVLGGAHVLRVHDLQQTREAAAVVDAIRAAKN